MTDIPVSSALLRTLSRPVSDPALQYAFETGAAHTQRASNGPSRTFVKRVSRFITDLAKAPRSPDAEASRSRRRKWAGSSGMPPGLRAVYTEGERAALAVIADQVKRIGHCDLPIDQIAAMAGVSRTTCQNAMRKAKSEGVQHITVRERKQPGRKNLTNIIRIVSSAWLTWLGRSIGFKSLRPSKTEEGEPLSQSSPHRREGNERECAEMGGAPQERHGRPRRAPVAPLGPQTGPFGSFQRAGVCGDALLPDFAPYRKFYR